MLKKVYEFFKEQKPCEAQFELIQKNMSYFPGLILFSLVIFVLAMLLKDNPSIAFSAPCPVPLILLWLLSRKAKEEEEAGIEHKAGIIEKILICVVFGVHIEEKVAPREDYESFELYETEWLTESIDRVKNWIYEQISKFIKVLKALKDSMLKILKGWIDDIAEDLEQYYQQKQNK